MKLEKGCVQIYTGNGKGKTTAAIGLGIRAVGNGLKVYMVQFLKSNSTGELEVAQKLEPYFKIFRLEKKRDFFWKLSDSEKEEVKKETQEMFEFCREVANKGLCDLLILDEIMGALSNKLITNEQILELIRLKPDNMELILTGRNAPEALIESADLVTEMNIIKHYYAQGIPARKGIEF